MGNAIFEQYGYKSARDLMTELARDIADGGELLFVSKPAHTHTVQYGYCFDNGYWHLMFRRGRLISLDYCDTIDELEYIMGV